MMKAPSDKDVELVNDLTAALASRKLKPAAARGKKSTRPSVAALAPARPSIDAGGVSSVAALAGQFSRMSDTEPNLQNKPRQTSLEELQNKKSVKSMAEGLAGVMGGTPFGVATSAADVRERLRGREVTKADTPIAATLSRPVLATKKSMKKRRPPSRKGAFKSQDSVILVEAVSNLPETPKVEQKKEVIKMDKIVARTAPSIEYTTQMVPTFAVVYFNSPGTPMKTAKGDEAKEEAGDDREDAL